MLLVVLIVTFAHFDGEEAHLGPAESCRTEFIGLSLSLN